MRQFGLLIIVLVSSIGVLAAYLGFGRIADLAITIVQSLDMVFRYSILAGSL